VGADRVIWLGNGLTEDDTDGHIDNLARFVDPTTVVCAFEEDRRDANYSVLKENYDALQRTKFEIVKVAMPPATYDRIRGARRRLSSSYMNFYIANEIVLVPTFQVKTDEAALKTLESVFPKRKVVGVDCSDLIYGAGTLHCISQQQPKVSDEL
jgi:agmatine deiminase